MKLSASILALLAGICISAQAATITISNLPGGAPNPIADASGNIIAKGTGVVALGTFADSVPGDVAGIQSAFQQFGDAVGFLANADGLYSNQVQGTVAGSAFSGANVFTVVGNGSDIASSTNLLVIDHGFAFKDEPDATDNSIVSTASNIAFGSLSDTQLTVNGTAFDGLQMGGIIPEPSSALLGLLGLSFLAFRRRK